MVVGRLDAGVFGEGPQRGPGLQEVAGDAAAVLVARAFAGVAAEIGLNSRCSWRIVSASPRGRRCAGRPPRPRTRARRAEGRASPNSFSAAIPSAWAVKSRADAPSRAGGVRAADACRPTSGQWSRPPGCRRAAPWRGPRGGPRRRAGRRGAGRRCPTARGADRRSASRSRPCSPPCARAAARTGRRTGPDERVAARHRIASTVPVLIREPNSCSQSSTTSRREMRLRTDSAATAA